MKVLVLAGTKLVSIKIYITIRKKDDLRYYTFINFKEYESIKKTFEYI